MLPQVPEQKGMYLGVASYCEGDFDNILYEDLGFGIPERNIGTEEFWKKHTSAIVKRDIRELRRMVWHCNRVIGKLELSIKQREL